MQPSSSGGGSLIDDSPPPRLVLHACMHALLCSKHKAAAAAAGGAAACVKCSRQPGSTEGRVVRVACIDKHVWYRIDRLTNCIVVSSRLALFFFFSSLLVYACFLWEANDTATHSPPPVVSEWVNELSMYSQLVSQPGMHAGCQAGRQRLRTRGRSGTRDRYLSRRVMSCCANVM